MVVMTLRTGEVELALPRLVEEPYPFGSPEFVDLELYLLSRAAGMVLETPAVRP
jgi:hypothetical protein